MLHKDRCFGLHGNSTSPLETWWAPCDQRAAGLRASVQASSRAPCWKERTEQQVVPHPWAAQDTLLWLYIPTQSGTTSSQTDGRTSSCRCPCSLQGCWTGWLVSVPSNSNKSMALFLSWASCDSLLWAKTERIHLAIEAELQSTAECSFTCWYPQLRAGGLLLCHCHPIPIQLKEQKFLVPSWWALSHVPAENTELPLFYLCFCFHCHNSSPEFPPLLLHMASHKGTMGALQGLGL